MREEKHITKKELAPKTEKSVQRSTRTKVVAMIQKEEKCANISGYIGWITRIYYRNRCSRRLNDRFENYPIFIIIRSSFEIKDGMIKAIKFNSLLRNSNFYILNL